LLTETVTIFRDTLPWFIERYFIFVDRVASEVRKFGADNIQNLQKGLARFRRSYTESWLARRQSNPGLSIGVFMCLV
jgi:hypothetical protein